MMNYKRLILPLLLMCICGKGFSQETVTIFANNKKIASFVTTENATDNTIHLKKNSTKKVIKLIVLVKSKSPTETPYRQSLEVTDSGENNSKTIEASHGTIKKYDITAVAKKYNLLNGSVIKLYLVFNPANPRMMIRSKRIFVAELTTK